MPDKTEERWFQLCQLAAVEQDPTKLLALVTEINRLLEVRGIERKSGQSVQSTAWTQSPESDIGPNDGRHNSADSFVESLRPSGTKKRDDPEQNSE